MGSVECFELCEISSKIQCLYCMKYWTEGLVYCDCGTCPTDATRKLNRERFDALKIPVPHLIKKGGSRVARHGRSEDQREYNQARVCLHRAHKQHFDSILQRIQACEIDRSSQTDIGWTEEFCKHLHELAQGDTLLLEKNAKDTKTGG